MTNQKKKADLKNEITPEHLYRQRRNFIKTAAVIGVGSMLAACSPVVDQELPSTQVVVESPSSETLENLTSFEDIKNYMNYYEFSINKGLVPEIARDFKTSPWTLDVSGLVKEPRTFKIEDILQEFPQEERVYRMRCVEGWSMVIPWQGFQLWKLLEKVQPLPGAKFVRFETLLDPDQMPGQVEYMFPWPYEEGLRLDEAMHDLTILATGLYSQSLPNENGSPVRLVVPWKYGFKSIKSIIKIELVENQPETFWSTVAPDEYGFYANVNPQVSHPRWSQATERRIGDSQKRPTQLFNGYDEVAFLYEGMNLEENF